MFVEQSLQERFRPPKACAFQLADCIGEINQAAAGLPAPIAAAGDRTALRCYLPPFRLNSPTHSRRQGINALAACSRVSTKYRMSVQRGRPPGGCKARLLPTTNAWSLTYEPKPPAERPNSAEAVAETTCKSEMASWVTKPRPNRFFHGSPRSRLPAEAVVLTKF